MKKFWLLFFLCISILTVQAQNKASISSVGASLVTDINQQTQADDMGLSVTLRINGIEQANTVSIGVGTTALSPDGISTIFEVVKYNRMYYLVEQNLRSNVENGLVTVFVHLTGKLEDYKGKYAIVKVTDKEGHVSPVMSVLIDDGEEKNDSE